MKISFNRNYNRGDLTFNLYKINKNIAKQKRKVSCFAVVPFAGTWIEIFLYSVGFKKPIVVPFAGTWIEIMLDKQLRALVEVVPFAGTWIEMII